ncbi:MAG: dTMP kinase [Polyangia bacterium]
MTPPRPSRAPLFVVLEGIDGSGTTTQLDRLVEHLRERGRQAVATREPSTGPIGRLLREILLGQHAVPMPAGGASPVDGRAMALLFAADRRDHLGREVEPALTNGADVVSDRYILSSLAYQAVEAERQWVETLADGLRRPDLTILLDVPIAVAAERRRRAQRATERYDADGTLERVAENYRRLAVRGGDGRWGPVTVIDASGTVDDVGRQIASEVDRLVDRPGMSSE